MCKTHAWIGVDLERRIIDLTGFQIGGGHDPKEKEALELPVTPGLTQTSEAESGHHQTTSSQGCTG